MAEGLTLGAGETSEKEIHTVAIHLLEAGEGGPWSPGVGLGPWEGRRGLKLELSGG